MRPDSAARSFLKTKMSREDGAVDDDKKGKPMSARVKLAFWLDFKVRDEKVAYMIEAIKPISDVTALSIMSGNNILSLSGSGCSCLYHYHNNQKPSYDIDLDYDCVTIWIDNKIIDQKDVEFVSDKMMTAWLQDYLFDYGWKLYTVDEDEVTKVFALRFNITRDRISNTYPF